MEQQLGTTLAAKGARANEAAPSMASSLERVLPAPGHEPLQSPWGVAIDRSRGLVVVADSHNHRVCVYTERGGFVRAFGARGGGEGELLYPRGVCVDEWSGSCAEIFVADCMNHRVVVATADGAFVRAFGRHGRGPGELMNPNGVCLDRGRGVVYAADARARRVVGHEAEPPPPLPFSGT